MKERRYLHLNLEKDKLFDPGLKRLRESYMMEDETSPQEEIHAYVSNALGLIKTIPIAFMITLVDTLSFSTTVLSFAKWCLTYFLFLALSS